MIILNKIAEISMDFNLVISPYLSGSLFAPFKTIVGPTLGPGGVPNFPEFREQLATLFGGCERKVCSKICASQIGSFHQVGMK